MDLPLQNGVLKFLGLCAKMDSFWRKMKKNAQRNVVEEQ